MRSDGDDCLLMEVLCDERKEYELLTLLIGYLNTYNVHRHQKKKMMDYCSMTKKSSFKTIINQPLHIYVTILKRQF